MEKIAASFLKRELVKAFCSMALCSKLEKNSTSRILAMANQTPSLNW
ncbi:MAG: hypothetical protein IPG39_22210 [Bacteroidetes bacterium]|nr:hypothetical protein [Bacteroidota bacterium]